MLGIVVEPLQPFYIVLELANEGNLYDFMKRSEGEKRSKPGLQFFYHKTLVFSIHTFSRYDL